MSALSFATFFSVAKLTCRPGVDSSDGLEFA